MSSTTLASGSAPRHGRLWGARARDWRENEEQQAPTYEEAIRRVGIDPGDVVLEVGCGTGVFLRLAADRGARVFGIDAAEPLVELARERVPEADVRVGDMQFLPWEDGTFDLVAGFNSFFFAADMTAALREAGRVAKPGAPVVIQVWGRPERCDLTAMKEAIAPFAPPPPPGTPAPPSLWKPGVLEEIARSAGLAPVEAFDLRYAFDFPDEATLARRLLAPGLVVELIEAVGEDAVRAAIVGSLARYRTPSGSYVLENEWHYLIARA
jgi:SAM-dependent methyltransferase